MHSVTREPRPELKAEIIAWSHAKTWEQARLEWKLSGVYFQKNNICPCGQFPISELCILKNKLNSNEVVVGNVCVYHFLEIDVRNVFTSLKRVSQDNVASFNEDAIRQAHREKIINDWEFNFYANVRLRRSLTDRRADKKIEINRKILRRWMRTNGSLQQRPQHHAGQLYEVHRPETRDVTSSQATFQQGGSPTPEEGLTRT